MPRGIDGVLRSKSVIMIYDVRSFCLLLRLVWEERLMSVFDPGSHA